MQDDSSTLERGKHFGFRVQCHFKSCSTPRALISCTRCLENRFAAFGRKLQPLGVSRFVHSQDLKLCNPAQGLGVQALRKLTCALESDEAQVACTFWAFVRTIPLLQFSTLGVQCGLTSRLLQVWRGHPGNLGLGSAKLWFSVSLGYSRVCSESHLSPGNL